VPTTAHVTLELVEVQVALELANDPFQASQNTGVSSWNGRSGDVVPIANDYTSSQVVNSSTVTGTYVTDALNVLEVNKVGGSAGLLVQYRIPVVGATAGDLDQSAWSINSSTMTAPATAAIEAATVLSFTTPLVAAVGSGGFLSTQVATQDGLRLLGRAGGTSSYIGTMTPTTLTASRTYTFPDSTGTVITTGSPANHNDLLSIQGGTAGEYYHLNSAQHSAFVALNTQFAIPVVGAAAGVLAESTWLINGSSLTAPAIATISAATSLALSIPTISHTGTGGLSTTQAATQDGVKLLGRAGGTGSYFGTLTPTVLTANRTFTLPDADIIFSGSGSALTSGRVPYATTGGILTDSANLLFNGTTLTAHTLTVSTGALTLPAAGTITAATSISLSSPAIIALGAGGVTSTQAATQDGMQLLGRSGGSSSYVGTMTPTTLTASRAYTFPDASGTVITTGNPANHNDLLSIQGGTSSEYYHLTSAQHSAFVGLSTQYTIPVVGAAAGVLAESTWSINGNTMTAAAVAEIAAATSLNLAAITTITASRATTPASIGDFLTFPVIAIDDTAMAQGVGGCISFRGKYNTGGAMATFAAIWAEKEDGINGNFLGALLIGTTSNATGYPVEAMRVNSSRAILINSESQYASEKLGVNGDAYINGDITATGSLNLVASSPSWAAGQLSYDSVTKTFLADTGFSGVRVNVGQENHVRFFNDTGVKIDNGTPVNASGVDVTNGVVKGIVADAASPQTSSAVIGLATADVLDGQVGVATRHGEVNDIDTSLLGLGGILYLAPGGGLTNTRPQEPETILILGTVEIVNASTGRVLVDLSKFRRRGASRSYSFTSQGIGTGTWYKGGFYDWSATDSNLDEGATTQTYGTSGTAYAAHAGCVPSGPGTVNTGQVGLRVTGTEDSETGAQVATQIGIITEDITTLTADVMAETSEKFSGQVTYDLYIVSGSPTAYSLDFNYGYSKYEDFGNRDATVTGIDVVWQGGGNDTGFDVALLHHKAAGWTYAATGFTPGNGDIARRSVDQTIDGNVSNGVDGAWKRIDLNQFIDGNGSEGVIYEIITGSINTIQTMDLHISAVSEELTK